MSNDEYASNPAPKIPSLAREGEAKATSAYLSVFKQPHAYNSYYGPPPSTYLQLESGANSTNAVVDLPTPLEHGYSEPSYRPPAWVPPHEIQGPTRVMDKDQGSTTWPGPSLKAIKEGRVKAICEPSLQVLCGPMLRYDTVKDGYWRGAVLVVSKSL